MWEPPERLEMGQFRIMRTLSVTQSPAAGTRQDHDEDPGCRPQEVTLGDGHHCC